MIEKKIQQQLVTLEFMAILKLPFFFFQESDFCPKHPSAK